MLRTNLNEMLIFMAVVDGASFVAGGQAMGLTRSAAGKAVMRLEDSLGVRLLNRTTRTLSLTDEGRALYDHGVQILAAVDTAQNTIGQPSGTPRGLLRLTLPDAFGRRVILPLLKTYLNTWPEVQVDVSFSDRMADIVEDGFDLAIRIGGEHADRQLVSRVVARYRALLCAAPSYLNEHGAPRDTDALAQHDCLYFSSRTRKQSWRFRDAQGEWFKAPGAAACAWTAARRCATPPSRAWASRCCRTS